MEHHNVILYHSCVLLSYERVCDNIRVKIMFYNSKQDVHYIFILAEETNVTQQNNSDENFYIEHLFRLTHKCRNSVFSTVAYNLYFNYTMTIIVIINWYSACYSVNVIIKCVIKKFFEVVCLTLPAFIGRKNIHVNKQLLSPLHQ